jgi:hypothetical protein
VKPEIFSDFLEASDSAPAVHVAVMHYITRISFANASNASPSHLARRRIILRVYPVPDDVSDAHAPALSSDE